MASMRISHFAAPALLALLLSACTNSRPANPGGSASGTAAAGAASASSVALTQWYHEYGEAGTQEAVKKYAAA